MSPATSPTNDYPIDLWHANPGTPNTYGQNVIVGLAPWYSGDDVSILFGNKYNDPGRMLISRSSTGQLSLGSGTTPVLNVLANGNVGIGKIPDYKFDVTGDINIDTASFLRFQGSVVCSISGCTSPSDQRLKKNITPLENSYERILKLQGVSYEWTNKAKYGANQQVGFIAQELEKVFPQLVVTEKTSGLKSIAYDHLVAPLVSRNGSNRASCKACSRS